MKSLYGLKKSPCAWFGKFAKFVKRCKYIQSQADHTLFVKFSDGKVAVLIVYVNDIILTGDNKDELVKMKLLAKEFEIKDLG